MYSRLGVVCPFDEWTLGSELGSGSYGNVYEIHKTIAGSTMRSAMKVIRIPANEDEQKNAIRKGKCTRETMKAYFDALSEKAQKEIVVMCSLRGNSHIVDIEDWKVTPQTSGIGSVIYIKMEYLTPLRQWYFQSNVTMHDVLSLGMDLCDALEACAKRGILHRDIKPENILVKEGAYDRRFKLGDFGISYQIDPEQHAKRRGSINYMAPEVYDRKENTVQADIYSIGLVLYRLLNQMQPPFMGKDGDEQKAQQQRFSGNPIPPPRQCNERIWAALQPALAFDPAERYASPEALNDALRAALLNADKETVIQKPQEGLPPLLPGDRTARRNTSGSGSTSGTATRAPLPDMPDPVPAPEPKKRPKIFIAIGAGVLALFLLCAALLLLLPPNKPGNLGFDPATAPAYDKARFQIDRLRLYSGDATTIRGKEHQELEQLTGANRLTLLYDTLKDNDKAAAFSLRNAAPAGQTSSWLLKVNACGRQADVTNEEIRLVLLLPDQSYVSVTQSLPLLNNRDTSVYFPLDDLLKLAYQHANAWPDQFLTLQLYTAGKFIAEIPIRLTLPHPAENQ